MLTPRSPRQKKYLLTFFAICAMTLLYFYTAPFQWEHFQNFIQQQPFKTRCEMAGQQAELKTNDILEEFEDNDSSTTKTNKATTSHYEDISRTTQVLITTAEAITSTEITSEAVNDETDFQIDLSYMFDIINTSSESVSGSNKTLEDKTYSTTGFYYFENSTRSGLIATEDEFDKASQQNQSSSLKEDISVFDSKEKSTTPEIPTTEEIPPVDSKFLVFSNHCRIPNLDPMHPSVKEFVEISPPLNCKIGHEPLTRTEGNVLILDTRSARSRSSGKYSCCYRSVFRENDGESDNDVGYGKKCLKITRQAVIEFDFIKVECTHKNNTVFYTEFHSFIHDHPKVEARCKKQKSPDYSVMIIGLDAMSRMNMHRQFSKTLGYLMKEMGAIEMLGFNKVGDNTFPNLVPLLSGYDERELENVCWNSTNDPLDDCNFLWKRFAKLGYRTFYAEDTPYISTFNYLKHGFYHQPTDYYFRHFIKEYEDKLGRDKKMNCHLCVGSVSETEAVLHWNQQFAEHFNDRAYFSFSWINSLTHDYLNMGSAGDHIYESYFRALHESGSLNRTIVIILGDHGMRWGSIRKTYIGRLEERLPILLIALPEKFKREFAQETQALKLNSHRLVTPFDLHATLVNLLHMKPNWEFTNPDGVSEALSQNFTSRAQSLFKPVPVHRSCDDAFIEEHWCTCETSLPMDTDNDDVKEVADFLVNYLNNLLKSVSKLCSHLSLKEISDARLWDPPSEHEGHTADDVIYTVIIQTVPGEAEFEGTVKTSERSKPMLLGTISRLNLYGNQSSCVNEANLRKYCYCL